MIPAAVLTVSDRSAAGLREDTAGPIAVEALRAAGFSCETAKIVPDGADAVESALRGLLASGIRLVVTTGGTGVAPRDETPEGTARVVERELPGIAEELRRRGAQAKPAALLTRGIAGVAVSALGVNLPGSPAAVAEGMPLVVSLAGHVLDQLDGGDHA
ncbi:MogA/MoaB family molybdenum cofactor biosynthesis protein [Microbacterium aerolatum]|uniref:Molybdenum cofactor biosynthesis protein n=1 Tax=Microbacterium aerolatum TaxID=153731 RepID=A0A511AF82_9MICO|nr:MogA/MoaB family molybdenum cofactor biosynthesis protein [Microbacterium aerolatum]GEK86686.1 molybdenum cofactor biosynthesis protein [Microbacterium aerolatum]GGB18891.1 molybdenum cofactor biosynthesis protein [Microbacterium aerolatum]